VTPTSSRAAEFRLLGSSSGSARSRTYAPPFLIMLIIMELIIINVSVIIYMILGGRIELGAIFIYYLVFRVCERVIELIILVLII